MQIELDATPVAFYGDENSLSTAARQALLAAGGVVAGLDAAQILLVSLPLVPFDGLVIAPYLTTARQAASGMAQRGDGRILFLLSAAASMPMRRHPDYSVQMAAVLTGMRTIAMQHGPGLRCNALGIGLVGAATLAGDAAMLSHMPIGRPGMPEEVTDTVLFFCDPLNTYTTGQILCVDGGWSAGYGRHF